MHVSAKVIIPVVAWLVVGVVAIQQGRRLVQVGYEIGHYRSEIVRVRDRNRQLTVQGSKLRSPKRVLGLAERLGLSLQAVRTESVRSSAPRAAAAHTAPVAERNATREPH